MGFNAAFKGLTVAILHVYEEAILRVVTPCILVGRYESFEGSFCVHLQNTSRHFGTLCLTCRGHILGDFKPHDGPFESVKFVYLPRMYEFVNVTF
jgi:hypothetical protein